MSAVNDPSHTLELVLRELQDVKQKLDRAELKLDGSDRARQELRDLVSRMEGKLELSVATHSHHDKLDEARFNAHAARIGDLEKIVTGSEAGLVIVTDRMQQDDKRREKWHKWTMGIIASVISAQGIAIVVYLLNHLKP